MKGHVSLIALVALCAATTLALPEPLPTADAVVGEALMEKEAKDEGDGRDGHANMFHKRHVDLKTFREAAVSTDQAVSIDDHKKSVERGKIESKLAKLMPAMQAAAVGVTEKAAADAVQPAMQPYMHKYYSTIRKRMDAEKEEAAAKALYDAAMEEKAKQDKVAKQALRAKKVAANAARQQSEYKNHMAQAKLYGMKSNEKTTTAAATVQAKQQTLKKIDTQGASQVAPYTAKADAAEHAAQAAKAALDNAVASADDAAKLKEQAAAMKAERDRLQEATKNSVVPEEESEVQTGASRSLADDHPSLWLAGKHVFLQLAQHVSSVFGTVATFVL